MLLPDAPVTSADYRRQARRIRASFDRDPFLRQQALSQLAKRRNLQTSAPLPPPLPQTVVAHRLEAFEPRSISSAIEQGFSDHAVTCLQPFGFTFSDRVRLLDSAERLGISRFRANMLLAMHEHQASARQPAPAEPPSKSFSPSLLMILGVEVLVVIGLLALYRL